MTAGAADVAADATSVEFVTTASRCPACVLTLALDDDRPRLGLVHWTIKGPLRVGTAVHFVCPNGHTSEDDPDLLKAFHSRRF
jgi:hypothetical protein